ncbi:MAG TPA: hypothetical protein VJM50_15260 [Pyrinomonadaceae bacterium]|nr:hypothetical protein [Pyrinomonadaceae bacterium]
MKRIFLVGLLLSTWVPMAFFLLSSRFESSIYGFGGMRTALLFLGTAHVPATLFFYIDKDFSEIVRRHRARYIYFPIVLTITTGLLFAFANTIIQAYILLIFWAWQAFHYGRQNTGIYSFASIATRGSAPDKYERIMIELGTYCGIIGTFKILGMAVAPNYLHGFFDLLYRAGSVVFVAILLASVVIYLRNFKRTTPLLTIFYFTLVCFFLPVFLSTDLNVAFYSYAIAHGVQYILFMTVVSLNFDPQGSSNRFKIASAVKLVLITVLAGFLFYRAIDLKGLEFFTGNFMRLVDFLLGAILGATMAHFVIDAGAWRLSQSLQRTYIGKRFGFVFARPR